MQVGGSRDVRERALGWRARCALKVQAAHACITSVGQAVVRGIHRARSGEWTCA